MNREEASKEIQAIKSKNILLELVTSFGKTKQALDIMVKRNPKNILILVPRLVLIQNWKDEFVKWKMYEPNITNAGEKEICQAVIDGKPYEQQNTATMVNAGIDIINGLSVASNVYVPLFVDNKESVSELIETNAQLITLEVVKGAQLSINKF